MKLRFKYQIRKTSYQQYCFLKQCFGNSRFVYNHFLADLKEKRETNETFLFNYNEAAKQLTQLKKEEDKSWLSVSPNECLQQALKNLDTAFKNMKKTKSSFPKFKSKYNYDYRASFTHGIIDFKNWTLKLPNCKELFKLAENYRHNRLQFEELKQGTITVEMNSAGEMFVSVVLTVDDSFLENPINLQNITADEICGIDLGLKDYLTKSDGSKVDNFNKTLNKIKSLEETIKHMQKAYSRKKNKSKRKEHMRKRIAQLHNKIKNIRLHMLISIAVDLAKDNRYKVYVLEDLNIKGMMKNHHLAHAIASVGWATFIEILTWQCKKRGKLVFHISRWYPSSKTCAKCNYKNNDLELKDRIWICLECGEVIDRDVNAAVNIKQEFINNYLQNEIEKQQMQFAALKK